MEKIRSFQITAMTLAGFKNYAQPTQAEFGAVTTITGGNGRGKSSVADAIAFAVTGLPFFGERGIDRLHNEENGELFLSMRFTDHTGAEHELIRTRKKSTMTITYDGISIRQSDLTEMFGERDVFLSILNPLYFIEELRDDGKKLLERYLPQISQEEVLSQLPLPVREALEKEKLFSPDLFLKGLRESIRELESTVTYLTGQKDLAEAQRTQAQERVDQLTRHQADLKTEADGLESRRFAGTDRAALQEKLVVLSERYEELSKEAPPAVSTGDLDSQMADLHRKLGERQAQVYQPKYAQPVAEVNARVKELTAQYRRQSALWKGFQAGVVCPTCRRTVTEKDLPSVQDALRKTVEEVVAQGREAKGQLEELTALEKKTQDTFLQFQREDIQKLEEELALLTLRKTDLLEKEAQNRQERKEEMEKLLTQIRALTAEAECGTLSQEEYSRLTALREELRQVQADLAAARVLAETEPEDYTGRIAETEALIGEKKKQIANVALYVGKRAELLFSNLRMNRVEISLFDVVKTTGEVKDTFRFTYKGRRYDRLSLSEKIRAGMEVSELIKRLTGRNYPQFIDNMESVDDLNNVHPTGQVIMAKCVRGAELSFRSVGRNQPMPQAA